MHIQLNGSSTLIADGQTLGQLLQSHGIASHTPGIAVARNEQIISAATWSLIHLVEGDRIEIVHAVQGG